MKDKSSRSRRTNHSAKDAVGALPPLHLSGSGPPAPITAGLLRDWSLPNADAGSDCAGGRVLLVGGTAETPGSMILAGHAALRAGATELRIASGRAIQPLIASQIPEARVAGLPDTDRGSIWEASSRELGERSLYADAVLIGPGMTDADESAILLLETLPEIDRAKVVLCSAALTCLAKEEACLRSLRGRVLLVACADELASALWLERPVVRGNPLSAARQAAALFGATVILRGQETLVVEPEGTAFSLDCADACPFAPGAGDVLAGTIAAIAACGAEMVQAAAWATYVLGCAGRRLAEQAGPSGVLGRELVDEIPHALCRLARPKRPDRR